MARAVLMAAAEQQRLKQNLKISRRQLRVHSQPFMLPDKEFIRLFRLNKTQFQYILADLLPFLPVTRAITAVPPEIKILAAITFYASGSYQRNVGAHYILGLSQAAVSQCVRQVTDALNQPRILRKYIRFPMTAMERQVTMRRFMDIFAFPGVVGCLDGTHVAIVRPKNNEEAYFNRKHYHSLNVLLICDADLQIIYVDASFGGQSHDSHVWNNCPVRGFMENLHRDGESCWLLGDSGYPQRPWLMTPILDTAPNTPEAHYTAKHISTRNVVERCIGVLKNRWRCLLSPRVLYYTPVRAGKITNACVVLHNLTINQLAIEERVMRTDQPNLEVPHMEPGVDAGREGIIDRLWRTRQVP